jgi:hypothetical protein
MDDLERVMALAAFADDGLLRIVRNRNKAGTGGWRADQPGSRPRSVAEPAPIHSSHKAGRSFILEDREGLAPPRDQMRPPYRFELTSNPAHRLVEVFGGRHKADEALLDSPACPRPLTPHKSRSV